MDGLAYHDSLPSTRFSGSTHGLGSSADRPLQRTLKSEIGCVGVGVHSGARVEMTLSPAPAGTGIVFRRSDLDLDVTADYSQVVDTQLCTVLGHGDVRISTVEHVMAALAGSGITNAVVAVNGPELPILDGSAAGIVFLIDCAGIEEQAATITEIDILRSVRVSEGEAFAEFQPYRNDGREMAPRGLAMAISIDFAARAIGRQALSLNFSSAAFRTELARARTFAMAGDVARLQAMGLALGGSLDNAVVVDDERVLNPCGLRMPDEFVRHKLLDCVGDLALAGGRLNGRFVAHRSSHALNNRLLRALFAEAANFRLIPGGVPLEANLAFWSGGSALPGSGSRADHHQRVAAAPVV